MSLAYDEKRQLIKQSAVRTFSHYGYQKTTLEDIAGQLGIKKNTLYYYFKSKEAIFDEIVNDEFKVLCSDMKSIGESNKDTYKKLLSIMQKLIYYGQERSKVYSLSLETFFEIGEVINKSFKEIKESIRVIIADVLMQGVKKNELKKHDSNELADLLLETLRAYEYKEYHSNLKVNSFMELQLTHIEKNITTLLKLILDGLKAAKY